MYDWWCFDRYSGQINAFTMLTMEIYLNTCFSRPNDDSRYLWRVALNRPYMQASSSGPPVSVTQLRPQGLDKNDHFY